MGWMLVAHPLAGTLLPIQKRVFANMGSRSAASTLQKPKPKPGAPSLQAVKRPRHAPDWGSAQVGAHYDPFFARLGIDRKLTGAPLCVRPYPGL